MDKNTFKEKAFSIIERLSETKIKAILPVLEHFLEREKTSFPAEEGWEAFMEVGEDGLGSKLHNASEEHDKYLYPEEIHGRSITTKRQIRNAKGVE